MTADQVIGYIFDYAPLLGNVPEPIPERPVVYGELAGFARDWEVAYMNQDSERDGDYWVDPESGERPDIAIVGLGIERDSTSNCNGLAIPVTSELLAAYDDTETRAYYRSENLSNLFTYKAGEDTFRLDLPIWTYIARVPSVLLFEQQNDIDNAFIPAQYKEKVRSNISALDQEAGQARFTASTIKQICPDMVLDLKQS